MRACRSAAPTSSSTWQAGCGGTRRGGAHGARARARRVAAVFVTGAGGDRIAEPGADLGIALAIASAARSVPVREGLAAFGEIGLTGRLRPAAQSDRRIEECRKFGVSTVLGPEAETLRRALAAALA